MTIHRALAVLLIAALTVTCTKVYNQLPTGPSTTPLPSQSEDLIEFRVFGNVGTAPIAVRFTNSRDGLTSLTALSLPYVVSIKNLDASIFLDLEATASPLVYSTASLQVQIFVNGRLFREAFAAGLPTLAVAANGTFRRGE